MGTAVEREVARWLGEVQRVAATIKAGRATTGRGGDGCRARPGACRRRRSGRRSTSTRSRARSRRRTAPSRSASSAETILYARHFLRELPVALLYGAAPAAAAAFGPRPAASPAPTVRAVALLAAALLVAGAWAATSRAWGADVAWHELAQSYLRDEDAPAPGAHWGNHLLSTVAYVGAAVVLAAGLRRALGGGPARGGTAGIRGVVVAIVALTLACGTGAAPFVDARHLGHQAREAATHLLVTLPAAFAVLLAAGRWRRERDAPPARTSPGVVLAAAAGGIALAHLAVGSLVAGAAGAARPGVALSSLLGAHCFEHALDVVLVVLLSVALAPRAQSREARDVP